MSRKNKVRTLSSRKEAVQQMSRCRQAREQAPGLFWARLDTMCQTLAPTSKEERPAVLNTAWSRAIGGDAPGELADYYNHWMHAFYLEEAPKKLSFLFLQAGSLMAKMEWASPDKAGLTAAQMRDLCIGALEEQPAYHALPANVKNYTGEDLLDILTRYTGPDRRCPEPVQSFFCDNYERYGASLQSLWDKLERSTRPAQKAEASESGEKQPAEDTESQTAGLPLISDSDMAGLCTFIEKTSSAVYQRALSRLYALCQTPTREISPEMTQAVLRNFFSALRTLEIEAVDEEILEQDFPEAYAQELNRREPGAGYRLSACGWSLSGYLITHPAFAKKQRKENDAQ